MSALVSLLNSPPYKVTKNQLRALFIRKCIRLRMECLNSLELYEFATGAPFNREQWVKQWRILQRQEALTRAYP